MKSGLAALFSLILMVGSAWLVQTEGNAYRQASRVTREKSLLARAIARPEPPKTHPIEEVNIIPTPSLPEPVPIPDPIINPAPPPPPAPTPTVTTAPPDDVMPRPGVVVEPIKDVLSLTPQEERALGRDLHDLILSRHDHLEDSLLQRRLNDAARPLLANRQRKEITYTFTILKSPEINAFSHPGGYVYVSQEIFSMIADEPLFQFIVGHEIAHVDLKHDARQVSQAFKSGGPTASVLQRFYHQIAVGHTDDQEYEADLWAFRRMKESGQTAYQSRRFLWKYLDYVERKNLAAGRFPPRTDVFSMKQDVENHWKSHPPAFDRLERLKPLP